MRSKFYHRPKLHPLRASRCIIYKKINKVRHTAMYHSVQAVHTGPIRDQYERYIGAFHILCVGTLVHPPYIMCQYTRYGMVQCGTVRTDSWYTSMD